MGTERSVLLSSSLSEGAGPLALSQPLCSSACENPYPRMVSSLSQIPRASPTPQVQQFLCHLVCDEPEVVQGWQRLQTTAEQGESTDILGSWMLLYTNLSIFMISGISWCCAHLEFSFYDIISISCIAVLKSGGFIR